MCALYFTYFTSTVEANQSRFSDWLLLAGTNLMLLKRPFNKSNFLMLHFDEWLRLRCTVGLILCLHFTASCLWNVFHLSQSLIRSEFLKFKWNRVPYIYLNGETHIKKDPACTCLCGTKHKLWSSEVEWNPVKALHFGMFKRRTFSFFFSFFPSFSTLFKILGLSPDLGP